jgi:pimeloyl-ACP methyl ester carboxylesterase
MHWVSSPTGLAISYDVYGSGPPLVLLHGSFSDHITNWQHIKLLLEPLFTVYAIARRGRGETEATEGHSVEDESTDAVAVIESIGGPVFLLGHSYGALTALAAAARIPDRILKLVLYEPASPRILEGERLARLEKLAQAGDWEQFALTFFRDSLFVPAEELEELRGTELWPPIIGDAKASLNDLRALQAHDFRAESFNMLKVPVMLQIGTRSARELYSTDALAAVLPDVRIQELPGQAHEAMTTAPTLYAQAVSRFLLS